MCTGGTSACCITVTDKRSKNERLANFSFMSLRLPLPTIHYRSTEEHDQPPFENFRACDIYGDHIIIQSSLILKVDYHNVIIFTLISITLLQFDKNR